MHQRHVRRAGVPVVKNGVTRAECSTRAVLAGEANWNSFEKKRTERERFGVMPFVRPAVFENLPAMLENDAPDFRLDIKTLRNAREPVYDFCENLGLDRGRRRR